MIQNGPKMTLNYPKLPQIAQKWHPDLRTFSAIFLTEKAVPQTFSLLECMLWVKSKTLSHCECENWKSTNDSGLCGTLPSPQKCPFAKWSLFKLKIKTSEVKLVDHWSTTRDRLDVGKLNQFPVNQRNTFDKIIELHRWRENWGKVVYSRL